MKAAKAVMSSPLCRIIFFFFFIFAIINTFRAANLGRFNKKKKKKNTS